MTHTIKHVGIIRTPAGEWNLYDQYPTNRRDYKITSAVRIGKPAQSIAFTTDAAFERWLERNMVPVQIGLL
tara:strand:- start:989 stop:1201 length:213 start_codon:yes stop_codon:yes gene_type:complete